MYDDHIIGLVSPSDLKTIEQLALFVPKKGIVVETGSFLGKSSYAWAKSVHPSVTVYCIDMWDDSDQSNHGPCSLDVFKENTKDCPNIIPIQASSPYDKVIKNWNKYIDLYFDDADHRNPTLRHNIDHWEPFIKSTGILCGHDYDPCFDSEVVFGTDVKEVVDNLYKKYNNLILVDSFWIISKNNKKLNI